VILSYEAPAIELDQYIDFYESKIFLRTKTPDLLKRLYQLKRKSSIVRRVLILTRDIVNRLEGAHIQGPFINDVQDSMVHITTLYEEIQEDVHNILSIYLSISSQRTNEVMRVLTVFSAFFLPLTFIVGVYGMNFRFMPELNWKFGYVFSYIIMITVTVFIYRWFKRKKWL
jgi:magnesium transporter